MKKISSLIKSLDLFGSPVELSFDRSHSHHTACGGLISGCFLIIFLYFTLISCYDLFTYRSIKYTRKVHHQKSGNTNPLDLNTNNSMFAFRFVDSIWAPLLPLRLFHESIIKNETGSFFIENEIPLIPCTESHFAGLREDFTRFKLKDGFCLEHKTAFPLKGDADEAIYSYIKLMVGACDSNGDCLNAQKKYLNSDLELQLFMINTDVDETSMRTPIKKVITGNTHILLDPFFNTFKRTDIFLSELSVELQKTFLDEIFPSSETINTFVFNQEVRDQSIFIRENKAKIAEILIQKGNNKVEYTLNSGSFIEIISYIGGLWSIMFLVLSFAVKKYNNSDFFLKLGNKIFQFETKGQLPDSSKVKKSDEKMTQSDKIEDLFRHKYQLKVTFAERLLLFFRSFLCCRKKPAKTLALENNERAITEQLDICAILRRLQEIDNLKHLLLSREQLILFNFIPRLHINLDSSDDEKSFNPLTFIPSFSFIRARKEKLLREENWRRSNKLTSQMTRKGFVLVDPYHDLINSWHSLKKSREGMSEEEKRIHGKLCEMIEKSVKVVLEEEAKKEGKETKKPAKEVETVEITSLTRGRSETKLEGVELQIIKTDHV